MLLSVWLAMAGLGASTVALVGPATAQTTSCTVSPADQAIDAEEQRMLTLVNEYRAANGKRPLALNPDVTRAAAWFSRDQASKNYLSFNHVDSNGRYIPERLSWCGVTFAGWAENVYAGTPDAESTFLWWKNSSSHNANLLRDTVSLAGIARAFNAGTTYGWYWTLDLTAPPRTTIVGGTWYPDGTTVSSGSVGTTVSAFAVGAFENLGYQMVLATDDCNSTVAVLNPTRRFADNTGFLSRTVGRIPAGTPAGNYEVCFKSTPDISEPTATGPTTFTLR